MEEKMDCSGCIYESEMQKALTKGYFIYSGPTPHPCVNCKRYPRTIIELPDHYQKGIRSIIKDEIKEI